MINIVRGMIMQALEEELTIKGDEPCTLSHIVTAVQLPTGAIEIAINTENLVDKLQYMLSAYDDDMQLKTNQAIKMVNIMIV